MQSEGPEQPGSPVQVRPLLRGARPARLLHPRGQAPPPARGLPAGAPAGPVRPGAAAALGSGDGGGGLAVAVVARCLQGQVQAPLGLHVSGRSGGRQDHTVSAGVKINDPFPPPLTHPTLIPVKTTITTYTTVNIPGKNVCT